MSLRGRAAPGLRARRVDDMTLRLFWRAAGACELLGAD
jgi:hypothetical protein